MRRFFVALFGVMLVLTACSTPASSEPGAGATDGTVASEEPSDHASGPASRPPASDSGEPAAGDPLLALELVDVRSGATFTLAELAADKPVLVEAMAIWCSNCRAQQREVVEAHQLADFHSVGIDVDPNERAEDLAEYAEREGFDWRFVLADTELVRLLTDHFGFGVTNPPSMPTFVISTDGEVRALEFGRLRPADELVAELAAG